MEIKKLLAKGTGWAKGPEFYGYFGIKTANALVATGKFEFHQVHHWGYILRRKSNGTEDASSSK